MSTHVSGLSLTDSYKILIQQLQELALINLSDFHYLNGELFAGLRRIMLPNEKFTSTGEEIHMIFLLSAEKLRHNINQLAHLIGKVFF